MLGQASLSRSYPGSTYMVLQHALCIPKGCSGGLDTESRGYPQFAAQVGSVSPRATRLLYRL